MPRFSSCTTLDLAGNSLGSAKGGAAVAAVIGASGSLAYVDVCFSHIVGGASQLSAAVLGNANIEAFNKIPIKEMRADSFTELDLSDKNIGIEGGMVVAGLVPVMASVTKILVDRNNLHDEGTIILCDALRVSTVSKVQELGLSSNGIGPDGAKAIADLCAVCASLTEIDIQGNEIGHDGALAIAHAISEAPSLALKKLTVPNGMEKKEHLKAACEARGVTLV